MYRTLAALIVLAMSGVPAVVIVCDALCAPEAATPIASCHGSDVASAGTRLMPAGHSCSHAQGLVPFVTHVRTGGTAFVYVAPIPGSANPIALTVPVIARPTPSPPGKTSLLYALRALTLRI